MEVEIREEIENLYGSKEVTVSDIKKRMMSIDPSDKGGNFRQVSKYIFDVKIKIPGRDVFNISGTRVSEILKKLEQKSKEEVTTTAKEAKKKKKAS